MALMAWIQAISLFTSAAFLRLNSGHMASISNHGADPAATAAAAAGGVEGGAHAAATAAAAGSFTSSTSGHMRESSLWLSPN